MPENMGQRKPVFWHILCSVVHVFLNEIMVLRLMHLLHKEQDLMHYKTGYNHAKFGSN